MPVFWCVDTPHVVAVVVELNCIFVNDNISVPKQIHRDLMDDIRVYVLHNSSVSLDDNINSAVPFFFVRPILNNRSSLPEANCGNPFCVYPPVRSEESLN